MNWDQVAGKWNQAKGSVKERWGKLTEDDLTVIAGNRDKLLGKIQERYGITKEKAEEELNQWKVPPTPVHEEHEEEERRRKVS
jgi:uncharacterized protein YjbJ (UPF0337 family)